MSRFRIFVLFATLAAMAAVFAACGGGDDGSSDDPQTVIEDASLEGVKSGELDLSLDVNAEGKEGGDVKVHLSGPFEAGAKGDLPQLDITAEVRGSARGEDLDFDGGATFLGDHGFVNYEGTDYEIDPTTFGILQATIEQSQQKEGAESGDITACQKAAEGIKFSQFADQLKNEGEADVEGTSTTKVSGDLNVRGGIDALIQLSEDPACKSQLEAAGPLSRSELEEARSELSKSVEKAHIDLYVGDDDIIRRVAAELTIQPPKAADEKVEVALELTLTGVNEEQSFSPPANPKPLEGLIKKLDIEPLELLEATEGGLGGLLEQLGGNPLEGFGGGSSSGE